MPKLDIRNCDNMELMAQFPDKYFDLAIVDPPYGISVNMNMGKKKRERGRYEKKAWDKSIPSAEYFKELFRVSKKQVIFGGNYFTEHLPPSMGWIFWDKMVPKGVSFSDGELAWTSENIALKKITVPYCGFIGIEGKRIHPTEKPVQLYKHILKEYGGGQILDTHLGSGSIAIVCHDYGFDLTACELYKDYYESAMKRINAHVAQTKLF